MQVRNIKTIDKDGLMVLAKKFSAQKMNIVVLKYMTKMMILMQVE